MTTKVITGAPASGKTTWLIDRIQTEKKKPGLRKIRVILPERRHKMMFQQRLVDSGGMLGVNIGSFGEICQNLLLENGHLFPLASLPFKHRVLLDSINTVHLREGLGDFSTLRSMPGFISLMHDLLGELQQAGVNPLDSILENWKNQNNQVRALFSIYQEYLHRLERFGWLDQNFLNQYTLDLVSKSGTKDTKIDLVIIDGFERFTPPHLRLISWLDHQNIPLYISLPLENNSTRPVYRRSSKALQELSSLIPELEILEVGVNHFIPAAMAGLSANFYQSDFQKVDPGGVIHLLEVQSPLQEARESLRWLKQKLISNESSEKKPNAPLFSDCAVVIPNTDLYQPLIKAVAEEFGIPVHFSQLGILGEHPAISVLADLLSMHADDFPRRKLLDVIRSPYLDLSPLGFEPGDPFALEMVSRFGVIISTIKKWQEVLDYLATTPLQEDRREEQDESEALSFTLPKGQEAQRLLDGINRFADMIQPAEEFRSVTRWLDWLEELLMQTNWRNKVNEAGKPEIMADLEKIFQGLRVAEFELGQWNLNYQEFVSELTGLFQISTESNASLFEDAVQVLRIPEVRGNRFEYVAILGLAEGSLPSVEKEDPFLPEALRLQLGMELQLDKNQIGQFFQVLTRANREILYTRSYLTSKGDTLEASPYWNAMVEILGKKEVRTIRPSEPRSLTDAASITEMLFWIGQYQYEMPETNDENDLSIWKDLYQQKMVIKSRHKRIPDDQFEGLLGELIQPLDRMARSGTVWSASRLETYLSCPMRFWVNYGLKIEEQQIPQLGLQAWQIGSILHVILEKVYKAADDPTNPNSVLDVLESVSEAVFAAALQEYHFEEDILWEHQKLEWIKNLTAAITNLASEGWLPIAHEQKFGLEGKESLKIPLLDGKVLQLHGVIDRIDRNREGQIRVIDYKTGSSHLGKEDLINGTRLQLPLYALAAQDALQLGQPVEGFYWALLAQKQSSLQLSKFEYEEFVGVEGAFQVVTQHLENAIGGISRADFHPKKPAGGCPEYCPAKLWCWRYSPEGW